MLESRFLCAALISLILIVGAASAQTTEFTYQGSLKDGVTVANGNYDFEFALFDELTAGAQVGSTLTRSSVTVSGGIFSVSLDFGGVFPGASRFLELRVRPTGGGAFNTLSPRQQIDSSPYSVKSLTTDNAATATTAATATNSTQLNGQPDTFYRNASNMNAGTLSNSRTTGTSTNTPSTLVLRDATGGFTAGSIALPTTTRSLSIPPTAFVPAWSSTSTTFHFSQFPNAFWGDTTGQVLRFAAPINLPDGATITEVRCYALDNDATQNVNFFLQTKAHTSVAATSVGTGTTAGSSATVQQVVTTGTPLVVDNDLTSYQVEASWTVPAAPTTNIRIASVRITYTVTSPLP